MTTSRRETIWIHALPGFLRGPDDFEPLARALEAPLIIPPSDPDSLNWSLERDAVFDDSVRIRVVAWDIKAWLASESCSGLPTLSALFFNAVEGALSQQGSKSKPRSGSFPVERHVLLGEGLGARVILAGLVERIRSYQHEQHLAKSAKGRKKSPPPQPRIPWDRVLLLGAHPGILEPREREARMELEHQWAQRFLRESIEQVREAWFRQLPYSSSPRMIENLQSEAKSWKQGLSGARLGRITQEFLLGRQEDFREDLKQLGLFGEEVRFLWVAGERDRKFVSILHELQDLSVPGEFWMCPEAGHAVHLDSPADLAEKIRFFLV